MIEVKSCRQENCPLKRSGECLEGIDLAHDTCPHFYLEMVDELNATDLEEKLPITSTLLKRTTLFQGTELTLQDIKTVTQKYSCDLVIILGDLDSGKTTLLATIYDLFQIGEMKGYMFSSSLTQKGFEIRSHLSRVASGADKADTERNKFKDFRILHVGVYSEKLQKTRHLLLSDVSGETIKQARSSATFMKANLDIAKYADHLFYIIDGEKLAVEHLTSTMFNTNLFLQNAISNNIFNKNTILNIIISKWDKIKDQLGFDLQVDVINKINTRFNSQIGKINYSVLASRPDEENSKFDLGFGVEEFLNNFFQPRELIKVYNSEVEAESQFDKFKMK